MKKRNLIIVILIVFLDQVIKFIINNIFYYGKIKCVINNFFYVTKVYNDGAAWSTFSGNRFFLIGISIFALLFLIWYQKQFKKNHRNIVAFGLVYGGLIGNMLDRIIYGYVIDYLKIVIFGYDFPIFNLADMAIVVGFILIIYSVFKGEDHDGVKSRK